MTPNSSLLKWLNTFQLDGKSAAEPERDAYYNLADGYVCARILNQISPPYFTDKWLDGIKPVPPNGSWRLRVSNLKRILQKIYDYASDLQSPQFRPPSAITPDVSVIAQNFDPDQICRLIQLILFCAINCDKKQDYIEKIRDLPTEVKQDIKEAIEELLIKNDDSPKSTASRLKNDSSINCENDPNQKQLNISSTTSQSSIVSTPRAANLRHNVTSSTPRRDSTPGGDSHRRNESHLDVSSQSYFSDHRNDTVEDLRHKLASALAIQDEKAQACYELESKLKQIQMERDQLAYENERLTTDKISTPIKLNESRRHSKGSNLNIESSNISDILTKENNNRIRSRNLEDDQQSQELALQQQNKKQQIEIQRLKEEIMRLETEKEDHRLKANLLKEDLDRVTMRHEELRQKAEQAKRLQDELDEHKHISEKVLSYENIVENLKKKNNELKRELKSHEEKNIAHIQSIVKLEEEKSQLINTVNQIEIYKKQLGEARVKLSRETHRADKAEVELTRLAERFEVTKKDYARLSETTNQLMRGNSSEADRLNRATFFEPDGTTTSRLDNFDGQVQRDVDDNLNSGLSLPVIELKERVARLETENELLQVKLNSKQENNKSVLNGLLDEATEKCKRLESENRQSRKKIMMLESNLKDLMGTGGGNVAAVGQQSTSSASGLQAMTAESSSDNVLMLIKRVEDQQRLLYQREQELRDSEAKYRRNIQKAKDVIQALNNNQSVGASLHPSCMSSTSSFTSNSLDETNLLRQQLREREDRIIELEREFYEFKKLKEVHERLILSAFYGLTTPMQWKNVEKRLERSTITSPPNTASSSMNHMHSKHSH